MEIIQKKGSNLHTFTFNEDTFNFAYADKTGSGDVDIQYSDFPQKCHIRIEQNTWLRNVGYLWCALGAVQLGYAIFSEAPLTGKGFWLLLGLACIAWASFSKVKYSVFQSDAGSVFVIQGNHHDEIINELNARRKKQLLNWYGDINLENEFEKETAKFEWLYKQGALSKEESDIKIAQVEVAFKNQMQPQSERLN